MPSAISLELLWMEDASTVMLWPTGPSELFGIHLRLTAIYWFR
jgi:hypothetical protein